MLTQKSLNALLKQVIKELLEQEIAPSKIILFGSYVIGKVHAYSDVDIAVWSEKFTGEAMKDFDIVREVAKSHRKVSFKLYPSYATPANYDPFIEIIETTGICIYEQEKQTR